MVNKDNLDQLEKIFREKFEEPPYDIPQDWNEPSGAVWENIEKELDQSNSKRFFYWYTLLGVLLLVSVSSYFIMKQTNTESILAEESKLSKQEQVSNSTQSLYSSSKNEMNQDVSSSNKNQSTSTEFKAQNSSLQPETETLLTKNTFNTSKIQPISEIEAATNLYENLRFAQLNQRNQLSSNIAKKQLLNESSKKNLGQEKNKRTQNSIGFKSAMNKTTSEKLTGLPFMVKINTNLTNSLPLVQKEIKQPKQKSLNRKVKFGAVAGIFNPNQKIASNTEQFSYEKNNGSQFGGFVQVPISKRFSIEGGLQLAQMKFSGIAKAQTKLEFKEMSEGYDEITFQSKHNLTTPLGQLPIEYVLTRNTNYFARVAEEDPVAEIKMNQELKQVSLPISMQYAVLQGNSFQLKAIGGLTTRYSARHNSEAELISSKVKAGAVTSSEIFYTNQGAELKKVNVNPHFGLEISKRLKRSDIQISMEPFLNFSNSKKTPSIHTPGANSYGLNIKISK